MNTKVQLKPKLDWDVKEQPVFTINDNETGRKAIMRNDNNAILGVSSLLYKPFFNRQLQKLCNSIEKIGKFKTEGFAELKGGKLILAFIRNHSSGLTLSGLDLKEYLVIGNSHDRTRQLFIGSSQQIVRCENQFSSIIPIAKAKHLPAMEVQSEFLKELTRAYEAGRVDLYMKIETLSSKRISGKMVDDMIVYLLNTDKQVIQEKDARKEILDSKTGSILRYSIEKETKALGSNAFGLFNGVTWYTTHELKQSINNFGNSTGRAQELNVMALKFCLGI